MTPRFMILIQTQKPTKILGLMCQCFKVCCLNSWAVLKSKMVHFFFFFSGCKVNVNRGVFIDPPGRQRKRWPGWGRRKTNQHIKFLFPLCKYISTLTTLDHSPHSALPVYSRAAYLHILLCTVCFSFLFAHCSGFIFLFFQLLKLFLLLHLPSHTSLLLPFVPTYPFHLQCHK